MTKVKQTYDLAIFQLAVYALLSPLAILVLFQVLRHNFRIADGWFWLNNFLILMLVAAGVTVGAGQDSISTLGIVLSAVGLCPLFLCIDSALHEIVYSTPLVNNQLFQPASRILFHLLVVAGAVLAGVGASDVLSSQNPSTIQSSSHLVKGGIMIFLVIWLWLVLCTAVALKGRHLYSSTGKLFVAVIISIPLLFVRVIYGILEFYLTSSTVFNPITGSIVAKVLMSVLPLMAVAIVMVIAGVMTYYKVSKSQEELARTQLPEEHEMSK